jgi:hypothetical protein
MMKRVVIAALFLLVSARIGRADSVVQIVGSFTSSQGESFSMSYQVDYTTYLAIPGTLNFTSEGPLGQFSSLGDPGPEGAAWKNAAGDVIEVLLFCNLTPSGSCVPDIGPNEVFDIDSNGNIIPPATPGNFLLFLPGQADPSETFTADVQVGLVPEPGMLLLLASGLAAVALRRRLASQTTSSAA